MIRHSPRFSIIVPAYNAAAYISQTIESVTIQTEADWELLVVDDGSTDSTVQKLHNFNDSRLVVISQQNQGVSAARNAGFAASRGGYVLFLDADDLLFPDALQRLGDALDEDSAVVLSYGTCTRFVGRPSTAARPPIRLRRKPNGEALNSLLQRNSLVTGAVLVRREMLERAGGFDRELKIGEDWALWCDLAALGPIRFAGRRPVLAYRFHHESAMRTLAADPRALWPALDRIFSRDTVRCRFSARTLAQLRRRAEASALTATASELVRGRRWRVAFRTLPALLKRDPASFCLDGMSVAGEIVAAWLCRKTFDQSTVDLSQRGRRWACR